MEEEYFVPEPEDIVPGYEYEFNGYSSGYFIMLDDDPDSKVQETKNITRFWSKEYCVEKVDVFGTGGRVKENIINLIKSDQIRVHYLTVEDITNLGWKHIATQANGGTMMFGWKDGITTLEYNGVNGLYKHEKSEKLREVSIRKIVPKTLTFTTMWTGECKDINKLKQICQKLNI